MLLAALMVMALYQLYRWGEKGLKGVPWLRNTLSERSFPNQRCGRNGFTLSCYQLYFYGFGYGISAGFFFLSYGIGLASCVLPLVWYVAAYQQGGEEFLQLVLEENVLRLLGKMSYSSHENPAYYNVITVVAGYAPYTLLVLLSLFFF